MSSERLRQPKKITDTEEENANVALNRERRCWLFEVFSTKDHHILSLSSEKWPCGKLFNSKWKYDPKVGDVVLLRIAGSEEESTLLKIGAGKELEAFKKGYAKYSQTGKESCNSSERAHLTGRQNRKRKKSSSDSTWSSGELEDEGLAGAIGEPAVTLGNPVEMKPHVVSFGWVQLTFCPLLFVNCKTVEFEISSCCLSELAQIWNWQLVI